MIALIFYYLILPFILFSGVLSFLRKFGSRIPSEIETMYREDPIAAKYFRALRLSGKFGQPEAALTKIGDFEKQQEAVDAAFQARTGSKKNAAAAFLVLNDKGEVLQDV